MSDLNARQQLARQILQLIDLTSLNLNDTPESMADLCRQANTPFGAVAALCVYPTFLHLCQTQLAKQNSGQIRLATVVNFPEGSQTIAEVCAATEQALRDGADEIDLVFPYHRFLAGDGDYAKQMMQQVRALCQHKTLKVILESGMIHEPANLRHMSQLSLDQGVNFLKTSTGKVSVNATPEAARIMLECIRDGAYYCGFKASGGIRSLDEALQYYHLAHEILGETALRPERLRFGASALLQNLLRELQAQPTQFDHQSDAY